jgi:hypothetical protein
VNLEISCISAFEQDDPVQPACVFLHNAVLVGCE